MFQFTSVRATGKGYNFAALGVDHTMPETFEASLRLGAAALEAAGVDEEDRRALFDDLSAENYAKMRRFNQVKP